jgi:transcriptional regulator with XRE-family HTH domain
MTGIGQRLKQERLRLKLSQSALGTIGGVETNAQGNYENGVRSPRADYLSKIAQAGVDVAFVVTGLKLSLPRTLGADGLSMGQELVENMPGCDRMAKVIERLQGSLHEISDNLYQMTRLADARTEHGRADELQTQVDTIKGEAEAIALATIRLIFVTSRLN